MGPLDDIIQTALRHMDTKDLVDELNSRFDEVKMSGIKTRMDAHISHEAKQSFLSTNEIKTELAKAWLEEIV